MTKCATLIGLPFLIMMCSTVTVLARECVVELELPRYPPLLRQARISGEVKAKIFIGRSGQAEKVEIEGSQAFGNEIVSSLKKSQFLEACSGVLVEYIFVFRVEGEPTRENTQQDVSFRPPNRFIIKTHPMVPIVD